MSNIEPADTPFEVTISFKKPIYKTGEAILVTTTVTNTSSKPVSFCMYHTPFEGIQNRIFMIERNGEDLPYQGIMKKRIPPTEKDFKTVAPGKSVSCTVDLYDGYELKKKGSYHVSFLGSMINQLPSSAKHQFEIR